MIQQMGSQEITNPQGGQINWQAVPHGTRARALVAVEGWMQGYSICQQLTPFPASVSLVKRHLSSLS